jgi:hypothetical protein
VKLLRHSLIEVRVGVTENNSHRPPKLFKSRSYLRANGEGFGAGVFGRVFAAIYARNLDRAIPSLVRELETQEV